MAGFDPCQRAGAVAPTLGRGLAPRLAHPAAQCDLRRSSSVHACGPSSDHPEGAPDPSVRGRALPVDSGGIDGPSRWFSEIWKRSLLQQASFCDRACLEAPHGPDLHRGCAASATDGRLWGEGWEASRGRRGPAGYAEPDGHISVMRRHQLEPRSCVVALKAPCGRNAHPVLAPECTPCGIRRCDNDVWRNDRGFFIDRSALAGSLAVRLGTAGDPAQQAAQDVGAGDDARLVTPEQDHVVVDDVVLAA